MNDLIKWTAVVVTLIIVATIILMVVAPSQHGHYIKVRTNLQGCRLLVTNANTSKIVYDEISTGVFFNVLLPSGYYRFSARVTIDGHEFKHSAIYKIPLKTESNEDYDIILKL